MPPPRRPRSAAPPQRRSTEPSTERIDTRDACPRSLPETAPDQDLCAQIKIVGRSAKTTLRGSTGLLEASQGIAGFGLGLSLRSMHSMLSERARPARLHSMRKTKNPPASQLGDSVSLFRLGLRVAPLVVVARTSDHFRRWGAVLVVRLH